LIGFYAFTCEEDMNGITGLGVHRIQEHVEGCGMPIMKSGLFKGYLCGFKIRTTN
jgi:hypothetical protein